MKKLLLLFVILWDSLLLTGCWDRTEINDLGLITGLAIDQPQEGTIELTAEIVIPKAAGGTGGSGGGDGNQAGGNETLTRSGQGPTIADAVSSLQERLPREVFWGQTKVVVIGEKLAWEGIRIPLDFLMRHPQPRLRARVFVAKGAAKEIFMLNPPLERSSSEVLRELSESGVLMDVMLKKLMQMLNGEGKAAAIPLIAILPAENTKDPKRTIAYINKTAIFKKDKMIGQIDDDITRGVLWFRNELKESRMSVQLPESSGYVSTKIIRTSGRLMSKVEGENWKVTYDAESEGDVVINGSNRNIMTPKVNELLQKELDKEQQQLLVRTLDKLQKELNADIIGFAEEFHRKHPKEWKQVKNEWDRIFPAVEVELVTHTTIRRPGLTTMPQGLSENEVKQN